MTFARANALVVLAAVSGVLLFASDYPLHAWPLQLVALAPLLHALGPAAPSRRLAALLGLATGLGYTAPLLAVLAFPPLLGGALGVYVTLLWIVLALGARWALRWPAPWGALAAAAIAVLVEWFDFTIVPVWGTAQSFVRVWSAAPFAIQFVSITGVLGLVFVLVAAQALAVTLAAGRDPGRRRATAAVLGAIVGVVAVVDLVLWERSPVGEVTVAAVGWTGSSGGLERVARLEPLVAEAAGRGAKLVVSPEVGFVVGASAKPALLARLGELARRHRTTLAVGWFDRDRNENRIAFFGPDGGRRAEYAKTHLIYAMENYHAGPGDVVGVDVEGHRLGGMICQDDNFTDLARANGRAGASLVAVPTNDWFQVANYHLENALFRGVEDRYAIVRAASNGISVIATPRGEVLARHDPFVSGDGIALATVPLHDGGSIYAALGDVPWVVAAAALLGVAWWRSRRTAA